MSGAALRLSGVTVRYSDADRDAISDIDLEVGAGEFMVLLGPSGGGKSTLLRTINRLIPLKRGHISVNGTDTATLDPVELRRTIGYSIQAVGLFPHMTVAENIGIVPSLLGWPREQIDARVDELLQLVRLDPQRYRERRPAELSGGEAQRVGVARAIAANPRVLLMDEPFGALDVIVRAQLQDELLHIVHSMETTTIFVTHDVDEALRLADRIAVIYNGRIEQVARPLDMLLRPATPYVAELLRTEDVVRRLGIMHAGDIAERGQIAADGARAEAGDDLHTVLNRLLNGADRVIVLQNGEPVGTIDFQTLRRAIAQARS